MQVSLYTMSIPVFTRMLNNLSKLLDKAEADAAVRGFDAAVLLQSRLYPDMFPLIRQVQIACDFAKGATARLAGMPVPSYPDQETSFADLKARIEKTLAFIAGIPRADVDAGADRDVTVQMRDRSLEMKGLAYLNDMAIPNFYFHLATAYALLRHNGVAVGKRDFVGV